MPKVKFRLPEKIELNDTFSLCDSAWSILFPEYWIQYRARGSFKNAAKTKILAVQPDGYLLELMEVAPQHGRLVIPVGIKEVVTELQIHLALALTHTIRLN